jgi:hypothetical protein
MARQYRRIVNRDLYHSFLSFYCNLDGTYLLWRLCAREQKNNRLLLRLKGEHQVDKGILADQATVDLAIDFLGFVRQAQLVQIDRARTQLVVHEWIVVHDLHVQVQTRETVGDIVKDKRFTVDGAGGTTFFARLLCAVVLIEEDTVLFEVEDHVRVALANEIIVVQVGDFFEVNGEFAHGVSLLYFRATQKFL